MAAAWVTAWPLRYILAVAKLLSKLPGAVLFTGNRSVVLWLVFTYGVFGAAWVISRRRSVHRGIPAACSVLALCAVLTVSAVQLRHTSTVTALDVSQGQSVVFSSGRSCVMVDCGGRSTVEDPGDIAAHKLLAQGYRGLDLLVLTHPHDDHVNGVLRLMHWAAGADACDPGRGGHDQSALERHSRPCRAAPHDGRTRGYGADAHGGRHFGAPVPGALYRPGGRQYDRADVDRHI